MRRRYGYRNPLNLRAVPMDLDADKWVRLEGRDVLIDCPHCGESDRYQVGDCCLISQVCRSCLLLVSVRLLGYGHLGPCGRRPGPPHRPYGPQDDTH